MTKSPESNPQAVAAPRPAVANEWGELVQAGRASLAKDWWEPERAPSGEWFVWGGAAAEVSLPPLPRGTRLELDVMPHRGQAPLEIVLNGKCSSTTRTPRTNRRSPTDTTRAARTSSVCRTLTTRPSASSRGD